MKTINRNRKSRNGIKTLLCIILFAEENENMTSKKAEEISRRKCGEEK